MTALIVVVVGAALALGLSSGTSTADSCKRTGTAYEITIRDGAVSDTQVHAKRCDTLTITNEDDTIRDIAFGQHDHHVSYDGVSEKVLGKDQSISVTLDRTGSYHWHDHLHDEVEGYFTVID